MKTADQQPSAVVSMSLRQLAQISAVGAVAGGATWGLTSLLGTYMPGYASAIASILAACLGMTGLVKLSAYRPLLIVLAASLSVWGLVMGLQILPWQSVLPITMLLFAAAYSVFAWIARIRLFAVALLCMVVMMVAVRLALAA